MNRSGTHGTRSRMEQRGRLVTPRRNNFFNGKKMDAYQFDLETGYGIAMRRMLNRMVVGGGVLCGLDVTPGDTRCSIRVTAGLAIDAWGREIVVPEESASIVLPQSLLDRACGAERADADPDRTPTGSLRDRALDHLPAFGAGELVGLAQEAEYRQSVDPALELEVDQPLEASLV